MKWLFLADQHPSKQIIISGLIVIACWIVFQLFSLLSGMLIFNLSFQELAYAFEDYSNQNTIGFLKYIQAITSFGMFIVASWIIASAASRNPRGFLKMDSKPALIVLLFSSVLMIAILPFTNLLTSVNNRLSLPDGLFWLEDFFRSKETQMQNIMEAFLDVKGITGLLINLLIIAVLPAVGEELIFRGIIQDRFTAWFKNHHYAILLTAFIFSALHFQFLSFVPRFFLGIILGYLFVWSGSIWITILAHFVNNSFAVIFYHLYFNGKIEKDFELIGTTENGLMYSIISLITGGILFYGIYRSRRKNVI